MSLEIRTFLLSILLIYSGTYLSADETTEALKKIASLGPGVHEIQKNKNGQIISCVIVGQARISTVLGASKGIQTARQKAELATSGEFVKWLNEKVNVTQSSDEETIILTEGSENNGAELIKESGKSIEKNSVKMQSISGGLVKGLEVLYSEIDADGKTYTIIKGWNLRNSKAVDKVKANIENNDEKAVKKSEDANQVDKKLQSKSVVSDEAAGYLKKNKKN
jgi:hypothetical protein